MCSVSLAEGSLQYQCRRGTETGPLEDIREIPLATNFIKVVSLNKVWPVLIEH